MFAFTLKGYLFLFQHSTNIGIIYSLWIWTLQNKKYSVFKFLHFKLPSPFQGEKIICKYTRIQVLAQGQVKMSKGSLNFFRRSFLNWTSSDCILIK